MTATSQSPITAPISEDTTTLRRQLETTQAAFVSVLMEKNFLQRAMADLNFHHNAHDGIVFTDAENKVVYANPYFLRMMGIEDPAELLNKPLPSYMWATPDDEKRLFEDVRKDGFVRERELSLYNKVKSPVFVACSSVASKDDQGKYVGTEIMLCNVTTKRRIQAELSDRTQTLERVTEFCRSTLGHLIENVQRGASSEELLVYLKKMQQELDRTV